MNKSIFLLIAIVLLPACGTTTQRLGTEQLLMSDAVDMAIAKIDFQSLAHRAVYLDTSYLDSVKGVGFVNAPYIVSSLRQQLTAADCLIQDSRDSADIIVEARVGALGTDGHEVIYGLPKNNLLNTASSVIPNAPALPVIPEISAARVDSLSGVAKLLVFAYDRETREPIWQSGVARAESTSRNSWILGAGPFHRGTVHDGTKFAGSKLDSGDSVKRQRVAGVAYKDEHHFDYDPPSANPTSGPEDNPPVAKVARNPKSDSDDNSLEP